MSNFVSLEEAAKKLGVSAESLVEMLGRGEIFGYRDGGSWKFKPQEIERVASEMLGDVLDEDPAGSSILVSDSDLGTASSHGSTIGSDLKLSDEGSDPDSDVALVPDSSGSDVRLVANRSPIADDELKLADDDDLQLASSDDDDDELSLKSDDGEDILAAASSAHGSDVELDALGSAINLGSGTGVGSDIPLSGSDELDLAPSADASGVLGSDLSLDGSDLIKGDSDPSIDSGALDLSGSDLALTDDSDLVLGGGSDLALGSDSGINLMSPSDSGISLEDEPLDLAASGISGLDLATEGSDVGSDVASGSAVDFQQDEEFQLSPSGSFDTDDDSGSQVIELEDSSEFGDAAVALPADDGFDAFADVDSGGALEADTFNEAAPTGAAVVMGAPEVPYNLLQVLSLLGILLLMCMSGVLVTDVVRNMWAWSGGENELTSGFTDMVLSAFSLK
ncbi:MAG: helix-turn-helix domain-containing protein [Pirellulaceae bacterium]